MTDDFLAVIKLISGEEILATTSYLEDENSLMIDCPVVMKSDEVKQMGINVVRIEPWIKSSDETLYMISMERIITLSEVMDRKIIKMYNRFINAYYYNNNDDSTKMTKEMGYISTVKEARSTLEKLYNNS